MLRAGNPEIVAASNFVACCAETTTDTNNNPSVSNREKVSSRVWELA
jgi:hypothetical protein